ALADAEVIDRRDDEALLREVPGHAVVPQRLGHVEVEVAPRHAATRHAAHQRHISLDVRGHVHVTDHDVGSARRNRAHVDLEAMPRDVGHPVPSSSTARTVPVSTASPTATWIAETTPATGARTWCSIFIASRTIRTAPASTRSPAVTATRATVP